MNVLWPIAALIAYIDSRLFAHYEVRLRLKELM